MLNHIIQELITKAIEKQTEKIITKKSQKKIQQEAVIFNKPHLFVSISACEFRPLFYHEKSNLSKPRAHPLLSLLLRMG